MTPRIEHIPEKKLVGMRLSMSLAQNKTAELWQGFMPRRKEIANTLHSHLYAMQLYSPGYFAAFSPHNSFEKWACLEVSAVDPIPPGMDSYTLPAGLYAVFEYKGLSGNPAIFQYIFGQWLPASGYQLAHRPHFELLGPKYKNNDPESEEEIWIPIDTI